MIKKLYLKIFKPEVYVIEKNTFIGDFTKKIKIKDVTNEGIKTKENFYLFSQVFIFERSAKKEIAKTSLGYDTENVKLAKQLQKLGFLVTNYEYIQVLEDGKASDPYNRYLDSLSK